MLNLKMPDINTVLIAGNLTNDPTLRKTTNGTPVANFYIASNRKFKDNTGQWRESVCFVGVVAWYKLADSCYEYLTKGSAVLVEGELQSRTWKTENGTNNNVVEIKARRIQFLNRHARKNDDIYLEEGNASEFTEAGTDAADRIDIMDDDFDKDDNDYPYDFKDSTFQEYKE